MNASPIIIGSLAQQENKPAPTGAKTPRLHALDSLRAIMMLLGVVLHSALTYNVTEHTEAWGLNQPDTHVATDFLVLLIHTFRMPVFFLIAGFFGALLFYERGMLKMIRNRLERIVYPFVVFLLLLMPLIGFSFNYSASVFSGAPDSFAVAAAPFSQVGYYLPGGTSHMWFLYYLALITAATVVLAIALGRASRLTNWLTASFRWLIVRPVLRIVFFAGLTYGVLAALNTSMVGASTALTPDPATFIFYGWFYLVGWILYKAKDLLPRLMDYDLVCTLLAVALVVAQGIVIQFSGLGLAPDAPGPLMFTFSSLIVWLFIFGITGLFLRYGGKHSPRMRYVSDAAYWVYLIHLPFTALLPGLIADWPLPALVKFLFVMVTTALIAFISYHYIVRATAIGQFLNGRRYPRGLPQEGNPSTA
jgi:peptidoglycan/LPS O-acetylase OafA/YrhL